MGFEGDGEGYEGDGGIKNKNKYIWLVYARIRIIFTNLTSLVNNNI
jgi:hypothetical protein